MFIRGRESSFAQHAGALSEDDDDFRVVFCGVYDCKPPILSQKNLLITIERSKGSSRDLLRILKLSLANAQFGHHPSFQGFVIMKKSKSGLREDTGDRLGLPLEGATVEPTHLPHVVSQCRCVHDFLASSGVGALETFSIGEVADIIFEPIFRLSLIHI